MTAPDPLTAWFRAELAATMRPCPEYKPTAADRENAADVATWLADTEPVVERAEAS